MASRRSPRTGTPSARSSPSWPFLSPYGRDEHLGRPFRTCTPVLRLGDVPALAPQLRVLLCQELLHQRDHRDAFDTTLRQGVDDRDRRGSEPSEPIGALGGLEAATL